MSGRTRYPSDLTDEQWAVVSPFLTVWKTRHPSVSGHQDRYELREIVNAIFYQNRTGCQWTYLPHDLPPKSATYMIYQHATRDRDQAIATALDALIEEARGQTEQPPTDTTEEGRNNDH